MVQEKNALRRYVAPSITGGLAGCVATIPMTLFMLLMHRVLPGHQRYALPPERLTKHLADRIHLGRHMNKPQLVGTSLLAHFGYGTTIGAIYNQLAIRLPFSPVLKGIVFGILIWGASYLGWIPAVELPEAANNEPIQRNALMILAHVIWGATTGYGAHFLESSQLWLP